MIRLLRALLVVESAYYVRGLFESLYFNESTVPLFDSVVTTRPVMSVAGLICAAVLLAAAGCRAPQKQPLVRLPEQHTTRNGHMVIVSDFKLSDRHPVVTDLVGLKERIVAELALPEPERDVVVYLFPNEQRYRNYLNSMHPGLPPRRAYFVGTKSELAVYTFWGEKIQEDLRHEYTHGVLHACLGNVPLWIDEGLAEYYEVPESQRGGINSDYPQLLASSIVDGWRPDLERLESLNDFAAMQRLDYGESWAWVHYLLHSSPSGRDTLIDYLNDLKDSKAPAPLSDRLATTEPIFGARMLSHVADLNTPGLIIRANDTRAGYRATPIRN
ncbi:DUF1570 domain-containing protein [Stratiformator vulcanicus]|uniref:DUF1570 domain-containing protein n=1 Tax=Stratiformator vulcanicus TaxID=2527980 RepID=UPI002877DA42|nr:DUF1570 domain-containing protein [Stratiformator vulcanicus]